MPWQVPANHIPIGRGNGTGFASTEVMPVANGGTGQATAAEAIGELIQALTEDTAPDWSADYFGTYDGSADTGKKVKLSTALRTRLAANRTYYVRDDGSDSNTGLTDTAGGAFLTLQKAANVILNDIDPGSYDVTVDITGAFTAGMVFRGPSIGSGTVTVTSTNGATITTTSANCITASHGLSISVGGSITFSTVTLGNCILAYDDGKINVLAGPTFGACAGSHIQAGYIAANGYDAGPGNIYVLGGFTVSGNAGFHLHSTCTGSSIVYASGLTTTISGTPAFSWFAGITKGLIYVNSHTFSGAATGSRYLVHNGGLLLGTASRTELPGNAVGTVAAGGVYTISDADNDIGVAYVVADESAARATPASGYGDWYQDSTDSRFHDKNDAGTIGTTVVADTGASNQFLTSISAAGVISKAQPTTANISGYGTFASAITLTSGQIAFPATQAASADANTLDDYEEGTFTPALQFGGATTGITYSSQTGKYTKIGNTVVYVAFFVLTSKGSATGAAVVTGLPFTVGESGVAPGRMNNGPASAATTVHGLTVAATSSFNMERFAAGAITTMADTDFNNNTNLRLSGFYFV